jgi:hypothetical protein
MANLSAFWKEPQLFSSRRVGRDGRTEGVGGHTRVVGHIAWSYSGPTLRHGRPHIDVEEVADGVQMNVRIIGPAVFSSPGEIGGGTGV